MIKAILIHFHLLIEYFRQQIFNVRFLWIFFIYLFLALFNLLPNLLIKNCQIVKIVKLLYPGFVLRLNVN